MHQKIDHRSPLSSNDLKELLDGLQDNPDALLNNLTCKVILEEVLYLRQLNEGDIPESELSRNVRSLLLIVADYQDNLSALKRELKTEATGRRAAEDFIKSARLAAAFSAPGVTCEG